MEIEFKLLILAIFLFVFIFIGVIIIDVVNKNNACIKVGLEYNWNGKCIEQQGNRILTYNLESIDWTGFRYKVNKFPGQPE